MSRTDYYHRNNLGAIEDLSQDMERVFDSLLGRTVGTMLRSGNQEKWVPPMDVMESGEAFHVRLDLPGVDADQVKIEIDDGKLSISGNRPGVTNEERPNFHRIERGSGAFQRLVSLPGEVDIDKIEASYEHGVLLVLLPKVAKQQPKKIQIRTGN